MPYTFKNSLNFNFSNVVLKHLTLQVHDAYALNITLMFLHVVIQKGMDYRVTICRQG